LSIEEIVEIETSILKAQIQKDLETLRDSTR
jgi:hypothetical protein